MKHFKIRSHNVKSTTLPTWPTTDKEPSSIIYDEENGYAFSIVFGPNPEITVFDKSDSENLGNEIHTYKVPTEKQKKASELAIKEALDLIRFGKL